VGAAYVKGSDRCDRFRSQERQQSFAGEEGAARSLGEDRYLPL